MTLFFGEGYYTGGTAYLVLCRGRWWIVQREDGSFLPCDDAETAHGIARGLAVGESIDGLYEWQS